MSQPTALYRHFDAGGKLLYVGISLNAVNRLSQHGDKPWFADIASVTIEWFRSRDEAAEGERNAVHLEKPLHNTVRFEGHEPILTRPRNERGITQDHYESVKRYLDAYDDWCVFAIDIASRILRTHIETLDAMVDCPEGDIPRIRMSEMYVLLERLRGGKPFAEHPVLLMTHVEERGRDWFNPRCPGDEYLVHKARAPRSTPSASREVTAP